MNWNWSIRPVVITIFTHVVHPSVQLHFSKSRNTKQVSSENSARYWRDCESGRGDHWWHMSCFFFFHSLAILLRKKTTSPTIKPAHWATKIKTTRCLRLCPSPRDTCPPPPHPSWTGHSRPSPRLLPTLTSQPRDHITPKKPVDLLALPGPVPNNSWSGRTAIQRCRSGAGSAIPSRDHYGKKENPCECHLNLLFPQYSTFFVCLSWPLQCQTTLKQLWQVLSQLRTLLPNISSWEEFTGSSFLIFHFMYTDLLSFNSSHMWVTLSSMYGKLLVLMMLAFCLTEVMDNNIKPLAFQVGIIFSLILSNCYCHDVQFRKLFLIDKIYLDNLITINQTPNSHGMKSSY